MMRWLALLSLVSVLGLLGCQQNKANAKAREVGIKVLEEGAADSPVVEKGDFAYVEYVGTLKDGTRFDANKDNPDSPNPYPFRVGAQEVIAGWDQGVLGMKIGEKRKLDVPYELAYGVQGNPPKIPGKSDLDFEVKLLYLVKAKEDTAYDMEIIKPGTGTREVKAGDRISVHYVGSLVNGKVFDDTRKQNNNKPVTFKVGVPQVVLGIDHGVIGMKQGEVRRLTLPPRIAFGGAGNGTVPANQVAIFEIELISFEAGDKPKSPAAP